MPPRARSAYGAGSRRIASGRRKPALAPGRPAPPDGPGAPPRPARRPPQARTSTKPGSETSGMPASDTSATVSPRCIRRTSSVERSASLVLVVADELGADAIALQQHPGPAGVSQRHQVGLAQRRQDPERDVLQVPDRGGADDQPAPRADGSGALTWSHLSDRLRPPSPPITGPGKGARQRQDGRARSCPPPSRNGPPRSAHRRAREAGPGRPPPPGPAQQQLARPDHRRRSDDLRIEDVDQAAIATPSRAPISRGRRSPPDRRLGQLGDQRTHQILTVAGPVPSRPWLTARRLAAWAARAVPEASASMQPRLGQSP